MSFSSSSAEYYEPPPMSPLSYHEVMSLDVRHDEEQALSAAKPDEEYMEGGGIFSAQELEQVLHAARVKAVAETEQSLESEFQARLSGQAAGVRQAVDNFTAERKQYFASVESEVIRLALAIAAKILHRESQADPMLIAAMVRIALDQLQEGSSVSLRVSTAEVERWRECMASPPHGIHIEVTGDPRLNSKDCILQAGLGSVDFGIDSQLKEVEQSFFDLLAQRPSLQ